MVAEKRREKKHNFIALLVCLYIKLSKSLICCFLKRAEFVKIAFVSNWEVEVLNIARYTLKNVTCNIFHN